MAITLSESAAQRIKSRIASSDGYQGLKLGVKSSGCSGLSYILDYAEDISDVETVFESRGVKVVVDSDALQYLDGTEIDYVEDGLSSAFHFNNPNVTDACGCGESFTTQ